MSLRLRLALLFSVSLIAALVAFGAAMHVVIAQAEQRALEEQLVREAQQLIASNNLQGTDTAFLDEGAAEEIYPLTRVQRFDDTCSLAGVVNRLRRFVSTGRILPLSEDGLVALRQGETWTQVFEFQNDPHLVYSQPILVNEQLVGVAQVALPMTEQERMLATLRDMLLFGGGAATVAVFGLTWTLAGRTLRPIANMAQTAQAIGVQRDFGHRIEHSAYNDEVGRLASSLNAMLDELQAAYRQAENNVDMQRDFVADVSHELRAPLTTVRGNLGLLQREPPMADADRRAVLRDAVEEIERMSRLVNELLLLARTNATQSMRLEPVELVALLGSALRKARALAHDRAVLYDPQATFHQNVLVMGNADALDQVLLILLDNAIKFTRPGGRITLSLDVAGETAYINVRDTGTGIPSEALPHVFERFYRANGAGALQPGHGLGLFIAKSLVEAQGGTIRVASRAGQGSVFTVSLPLVGQ